MQTRSTSSQNRNKHTKNPSFERNFADYLRPVTSEQNPSTPGVQILSQQIEPDQESNPIQSSKRVSITITPVQLE